MIDGPQIPTQDLKRQWLYEVAEQEIAMSLPPQLTDCTLIRMDDVRTLMITCWIRGATWQREQSQTDSAQESPLRGARE